MAFSPLEVVKLLPRSNCGQCGEASCLAFAVALSTGQKPPEACPYLDLEKLPKDLISPTPSERDQVWRILEEIKIRIKEVDLERVAPGLGIKFQASRLCIPYLDTEVLLSQEEAYRRDGLPLDPRDQILLYNYVLFQGHRPLTGEFVGLEAFPHSISKVATLRRYAEEKLARALEENLEKLKKGLSRFRHRLLPERADLAVEIWVLPRVPLRVHFWKGEPEEGLSPEVKILYDVRATEYLDLESLVFCAERLTERWLEIGEEICSSD